MSSDARMEALKLALSTLPVEEIERQLGENWRTHPAKGYLDHALRTMEDEMQWVLEHPPGCILALRARVSDAKKALRDLYGESTGDLASKDLDDLARSIGAMLLGVAPAPREAQ